MSPTRPPFRILAAALLAGVLLSVAAGSVQAEEPSALERLSPDERARLAEKVPDWDDLDRERQERIARNHLRVRQLSPKERERLQRRIDQLKRHREEGMGPPHGRHGDFRDPKRRRDLMRRGHVVRAAGLVLWEDVSPETRAAVRKAVGPKYVRGVEMAFFRRFWEAMAREKAATGAVQVELPDEVPEHVRRMVKRWKEEAASGNEGARVRLAHVAVGREVYRLTDRLEKAGEVDEDLLREIGSSLKEQHAAAFEKARAELEKLASNPEALQRYARRGQHGRGGSGNPRRSPGRGASLEDRARHLRDAIEQAGPLFRRYPALQEQAMRLKRALEEVVGASGNRGAGRRPSGRRPPFGPGGRPGVGPGGRPGGDPGGRRGPGRERPPGPPPSAPEDEER